MRVGLLVTNHGTHPPEKWAAESAAQLTDVIQIDEASIAFDSLNAAKDKFQSDIEAALVEHHDIVQSHELDALNKDGLDRLDADVAPESDHLNDAVATVQAVADTSMFGAHFRKPEVEQFVRSTLGSHFASVRHIERSTLADKNAGHPKAKAFRIRYHG